MHPVVVTWALLAAISGSGWAPPDDGVGFSAADGQCLVRAPPQMTPVIDRSRRRPEGDEAERLRRYKRRLAAPGGVIEDPCADVAGGCTPALDAAFAAFDRAAIGHGRAGVVVFGNSLIAADRIVNVVRRRLQEQLGDGGRGYVLADRLGEIGPRDRTADGGAGFHPTTIAEFEPNPEAWGVPHSVAGSAHISLGPALSRFRLHSGERLATVFAWGRPRERGLQARVDGGRWHRVRLPEDEDEDEGDGEGDGEGASEKGGEKDGANDDDDKKAGRPIVKGELIMHQFRLPKTAKRFELRAKRAGAIVHGVALEHDRGGVVVDTFGVAAADAPRFVAINDEIFQPELDARQPDLVVLMLGGNETKRIAWGQRDFETVRDDLTALIRKTHPGPDRACLVVGPIDAVVGTRNLPEGADPFRQRPELVAVNEIHRDVALKEGCAFFDLYAAMGGKGSLKRMDEAGTLHADLVHPKEGGLAVLGTLIADALMQAWRTTPHDEWPWRHEPAAPTFSVSTSLVPVTVPRQPTIAATPHLQPARETTLSSAGKPMTAREASEL
jgi:lysophospholipase L1-like esterase